MAGLRWVSLAVFALVCACGSPPEGDPDTSAVVAETRADAPREVAPAAGTDAAVVSVPTVKRANAADVVLALAAQMVDLPHARVATSKDGRTFIAFRDAERDEHHVVTSPGVVEIWRLGDVTPSSRVRTAFVVGAVVNDEGTKAAWLERSEVITTVHLHTLDLETGVHARFASKAGCADADERLGTIRGEELETGTTCAGAERVSYDFATGRVMRRSTDDLEAAGESSGRPCPE